MKKWIKEWPIRVSIVVSCLNMEAVVIPLILIKFLGLSGLFLKFATSIWATAEICYWFWFSGWIIGKFRETQSMREAVGIGKEFFPQIKESGFIDKIQEWIKSCLIDRFNPENYKRKKIFRFLIGCGYLMGCFSLFFIGLVPVVWIPGLMLCRAFNWKTGFAFLILGNIIKNIGFATGWEYIFTLF